MEIENVKQWINNHIKDVLYFILIIYVPIEAGNLSMKDAAWESPHSSKVIIFFSYLFVALVEWGCSIWFAQSLSDFIKIKSKETILKTLFTGLLAVFVTQCIVLLHISNSEYINAKEYNEEIDKIMMVNKVEDLETKEKYYKTPYSFIESIEVFKSFAFKGSDVRTFIVIEISLLMTILLGLFKSNTTKPVKVVEIKEEPKEEQPSNKEADKQEEKKEPSKEIVMVTPSDVKYVQGIAFTNTDYNILNKLFKSGYNSITSPISVFKYKANIIKKLEGPNKYWSNMFNRYLTKWNDDWDNHNVDMDVLPTQTVKSLATIINRNSANTISQAQQEMLRGIAEYHGVSL